MIKTVYAAENILTAASDGTMSFLELLLVILISLVIVLIILAIVLISKINGLDKKYGLKFLNEIRGIDKPESTDKNKNKKEKQFNQHGIAKKKEKSAESEEIDYRKRFEEEVLNKFKNGEK